MSDFEMANSDASTDVPAVVVEPKRSRNLKLLPHELLQRQRAQQIAWKVKHIDKVRAYNKLHNSKPSTIERKAKWWAENKDRFNARKREERLDAV